MPRIHFKSALTAALIALAAANTAAQGNDPSAYAFLNVTGSSRIYGLGGVNISLVDPDDVMLTEQNPALMGPEMSRGLGLGYMRYFWESNFASARYVGAAGRNGAWGVGLHYYGYGQTKEALPDGTVVGTFSPSDAALSAGYSHNLGRNWRGGFNIRLLYSSYAHHTALAIATDLGINWFDEDHDSSLSLVVSNLGGQVKKFNDHADRLPIDVRLGWSKGLGNSPINLSITAWHLTRWSLPYWHLGDGTSEAWIGSNFAQNLFRHLVFGAEWRASNNFSIDLGYNYKTMTDMATYQRNFLSGFSIGANLRVRAFGVGVALAQPHKNGATFMLNITTNLYDF